MGFTCILSTNTFLVGRFWDFNVIYLCVKFEVTSYYTWEVMPGQKFIEKIYKGH